HPRVALRSTRRSRCRSTRAARHCRLRSPPRSSACWPGSRGGRSIAATRPPPPTSRCRAGCRYRACSAPTTACDRSGAVLAVRGEERTRADRELVAVKVPDYSGDAARALSEQEFERSFRDEAGALLVLPKHPNLARFITFDASAQPKPILVMEFVHGPNL